jgi:hypothetical protein
VKTSHLTEKLFASKRTCRKAGDPAQVRDETRLPKGRHYQPVSVSEVRTTKLHWVSASKGRIIIAVSTSASGMLGRVALARTDVSEDDRSNSVYNSAFRLWSGP